MLSYPSSPKPSFSYDKGEEFNTLINSYASGRESRAKLMRFPKHNFACVYKNISLSDRNLLHTFFRRVFGSGDDIWYVDVESREWVDEYIGRGGPLPLIGAITDDGGVLTSEIPSCLDATANGMHFLPALPVVNDAYYFGSGSQLDKLTPIIGTAGAGVWTITWEYWDGDSWAALAGVTDGSTGFKAAPGAHDVTFTVPTDWAMYSVNDTNAYWVRARVSAFTSITVRPLGSGCTSNSKTYDIHGVTTSSVSIKIDNVLKTAGGTDYTFVSGGGGGGADRVLFVAYPAVGSLITSDHTGFLRIKGRLDKDGWQERIDESRPTDRMFQCGLSIKEVQF